MYFFKRYLIGIILIIGLPPSFPAQIPTPLKSPFNDLLRLNNSRQYPAAILQGKILLAQAPDFSNAYGQLAFAFEKAGQIEQGLVYFDSLRQISPENSYSYYAIALLEKSRKNVEQAIGNLKVCIKLDPKFAQAYSQLVEVYNAQEDLETPANYFSTLIEEDSLNAAAYCGLGCVYQLKKQWRDGAESFDKCLALNPDLVQAYYLKGLMHINQRDPQNALAAWDNGKEVAAKLNDIEWQGKMTANVGNAYHDMGQYQKAIPYREEALKLAREIGDKNQETRHLGNLANTYKALRQFDKALEGFQQAMAIAKETADSTFQETLLGNLSAMYVDMGDYKTGVEYGTKALKLAEARGDSQAVASHCWNTGAGYANQADYYVALSYYQRAITIKKQSGNSLDVGRLLSNMGNVYKEMGDVPKAIDFYTQSLQIAKKIPHKPLEEFALGSLGYAYSGLSDYAKANDYFQQALALAEEIGDVDSKGTFIGNIGVVQKKWGNFTKALENLKEALRIHEGTNNPRAIIRHYVNMATIYEIQGDYLRALDNEEQALETSQKIGTKNYTAICLGNIGVLYDKVGDQDEALKYLQQALEINREIGFKESEIAVLANMGCAYENKGEDAKAEDVFKKSLATARFVGQQEGETTALSAIGDIHTRRKEYSKALSDYNQALAIAKKIGQKIEEGRLYLNLGNVHLEQGDIPAALAFFQKALEVGKKLDAFELIYESLAGFAAVAEKQKRYDEACKYYDQAIEKIESVRERLRIESYKTTFMENKLSVYESLITLLIRLGRYEEAYKYLQRFRARGFLEILSPQRLDFTEGISRERFARYRLWEQKLRQGYDLLAVEYGAHENKRDNRKIAALQDSLQRIQQEHEKVCDEIRLYHPRAAEAQGLTRPLNLREVQQNVLQRGQTLVEYFVGPDLTAAWVIQSGGFHCEVVEIKRDELEELIEQLRRPFKEVKDGVINNLADVGYDVKLAQQLYMRIFQPIEKHLSKNGQLLVVPDGVLHYLPFEALVTGTAKKRPDPAVLFSRFENAHFLVEKYAISYVPAASIVALANPTDENKREKLDSLLAFGCPDFGHFMEHFIDGKEGGPAANGDRLTAASLSLKAARGSMFMPLSDRDVHEVAKIVQPAKLYLAKEATEAHFKETAGGFPHIYVSTHAIVDESRPMYSLIVFAQDENPQEDGFLHTYEIYNLQLDADLVTLGACETGLGKLSRGEGLIGLTRAFIYAGAPSVLVSLWSVDESTAALMKIFYQNLKEGAGKAEALRQAKLKLLHTREGGMSFAHPFLWAPFVLVGEGD